jgi:hypothetical protein
MTVSELIEKLAEFPPDMPVCFYDGELLRLEEVEWVGLMADNAGSCVVAHPYQPSTKNAEEWITRA